MKARMERNQLGHALLEIACFSYLIIYFRFHIKFYT